MKLLFVPHGSVDLHRRRSIVAVLPVDAISAITLTAIGRLFGHSDVAAIR